MREFAKQHYDHFCEINFFETPKAKEIFDGDLDADTIIMGISAFTKMKLEPKKTLIFLDEIQNYLVKNNSDSVKAIQKVLDFMKANDNYTIPQLVEISGMKKSTFYTVFAELTGSTPVLTKQRFQAYKAEILLSGTDLSIEEIAHKTGFNSVAHFRKIFKSRYSKSPKHIRKPETE